MPTLATVAQEKEFAENMNSLMGIMKGIAISAFLEAKKNKETRFERFVSSFGSIFQIVDLSKAKHPFIQSDKGSLGVVLITSDLAFMGGLNSKIVKQGLDLVEKNECEFMVCGTKGAGKIKSSGKPFTAFPAMTIQNMYELAVSIKNHIVKRIKEGKMSKAVAIFAKPVSMITQEIRTEPLLPAHDVYDQALNADVDPEDKIILESKIDNLMTYLADIWITHKLYEMFEDNKMSEYSSQSVTLDGSLDNLKELNKKVKLLFVKTRREVIDSSLRETIASMLCIK